MRLNVGRGLLFVAVVTVCALPVAAQDAGLLQNQNDQDRPIRQADQGTESKPATSRLDNRTSGSAVRVSKLSGMDIQNPQGQNLGEIKDLVVDAQTGKIKYAAVTYGGFLGLGNKLFAVPFEAFKFQQDPEDKDEVLVVLNINQQQLEGAEGFDDDKWPDFADAQFTSELDRRYNIDRSVDPATRIQNPTLRSGR